MITTSQRQLMNDLVSSLGNGCNRLGSVKYPTLTLSFLRSTVSGSEKEGGTDPEVIAMEYGYSSASEMFLDLATARDMDKVAQEKAKAELDAELNVDIDPESVRLAADKAIRGKEQA